MPVTPPQDPTEPGLIKIQNLFNDYPSLQSKLQTLAGQTNINEERGLYIVNTSNNIVQYPPIGMNGYVTFNSPSTGMYICMAHTHNSPASSTYSIFSWTDLEGIAQLLKKGGIDASRFVSFLFTADGTRYALTISSEIAFSKFFAFYGDPNFSMSTGRQRMDAMETYYINENEDPLITENTSPGISEQNFLDMLQNYDMGLTIFEVDQTLTSFTKLN